MTGLDDELISLHEAKERDVSLSASEAAELQSAGLYVQILSSVSSTSDELRRPYRVHGNHNVGFFRLSSGRLVRIKTKVPIANVFALLAVSYRSYSEVPPFLERTVPYSTTRAAPLQALVEHFTLLVEKLLRDGLLRRYIEEEENLSVLRGRLMFDQHLRRNIVRGDRLFCRFSSSSVDIWENRIVLWTLLLLHRYRNWPQRLSQKLQTQMMHFGGISIIPIRRMLVPKLVYDRLNSRYREIHDWCRFFIDQMMLLDRKGDVEFHGFVPVQLEMEKAFSQ